MLLRLMLSTILILSSNFISPLQSYAASSSHKYLYYSPEVAAKLTAAMHDFFLLEKNFQDKSKAYSDSHQGNIRVAYPPVNIIRESKKYKECQPDSGKTIEYPERKSIDMGHARAVYQELQNSLYRSRQHMAILKQAIASAPQPEKKTDGYRTAEFYTESLKHSEQALTQLLKDHPIFFNFCQQKPFVSKTAASIPAIFIHAAVTHRQTIFFIGSTDQNMDPQKIELRGRDFRISRHPGLIFDGQIFFGELPLDDVYDVYNPLDVYERSQDKLLATVCEVSYCTYSTPQKIMFFDEKFFNTKFHLRSHV